MPHDKTISVSQAVQSLVASGILSKSVAQILAMDDRSVQLADITRGFVDPMMMCVLIDASGSMTDCQGAVIEAQNVILDTLRDTSKCRQKALYVAQYLFSTDSRSLNPFVQLNPGKNDSVVVLNSGNYYPNGMSALRVAVYHVLQDMAGNLAHAHGQQINASFALCVITDGENTEDGRDLDNIKTIVEELKSKGYLKTSMVIGFTDTNFTTEMVHEIRGQLGFDEDVAVSKKQDNIQRKLRLAFAPHARARIMAQ